MIQTGMENGWESHSSATDSQHDADHRTHQESRPSSPACGLRHYILVNITRCAVWRRCYQFVSADLTAPHLQATHMSPFRADLDNRTPTIIFLPVSCPVVPLGPSQWRGTRGHSWAVAQVTTPTRENKTFPLSSIPLRVKRFAHATGLALQSAHASVRSEVPGLSVSPVQQRAGRRETYSAEQIEQYCMYGDC